MLYLCTLVYSYSSNIRQCMCFIHMLGCHEHYDKTYIFVFPQIINHHDPWDAPYYLLDIFKWVLSYFLNVNKTLFFSILDSVQFHINFRIVFSVSSKILLGFCSMLHWIYSHFENDWHLSNTGVPSKHEHVLPFLPPCHWLDISQ